MLTKIRLRNFQKHKDKTIKLSRTVTTIVGVNEAGKSTLIRAFRLVCLNKMASKPEGYIRHGANCLDISLWLDKHVVGRRKGKQTNQYRLDGQVYKSFGHGKVPEDIANLINIGPANFQRQHDLPYWFSESAGQVSKNLNEIVNLEVIDQTLANVASEVRKAKSAVEVSRDRLKESKEKRKSLSWVPEFGKDVERLERLHQTYLDAQKTCDSIASALREGRSANRTQRNATRAFLGGKKAVTAGMCASEVVGECGDLENLIDDADNARALVVTEVPDMELLFSIRAEGDTIAEDCSELDSLIDELERAKEELCQASDSLDVATKKLGKVKVCPTCGAKVESSQWSRRICTDGTNHQSPVQKRTGSRR